MKIVIIIPTYNEKHNIIELINALQQVFKKIPHDMNILVVDDNSPDGTGELVRNHAEKHSNIRLITGRKQGLGSAYIRGMEYALGHMRADVVMEMDADFSHDPEDVPRLIACIDQGADFVIGSRYVKGGRLPADWGIHRRAISRIGNIAARYLLHMKSVKDCTAGFRAIRSDILKKIDLPGLRVQGYAFQIALLSHAMARKAVIEEIPVVFVDRKRGRTKLGYHDILEFFEYVLQRVAKSSK